MHLRHRFTDSMSMSSYMKWSIALVRLTLRGYFMSSWYPCCFIWQKISLSVSSKDFFSLNESAAHKYFFPRKSEKASLLIKDYCMLISWIILVSEVLITCSMRLHTSTFLVIPSYNKCSTLSENRVLVISLVCTALTLGSLKASLIKKCTPSLNF